MRVKKQAKCIPVDNDDDDGDEEEEDVAEVVDPNGPGTGT